MKICFKCKQNKSIECFGVNTRKKDGLQDQCKDCKKAFQHDWYEKNKQKHIANVKDIKALYKLWFRSVKEKLSCVKCGFSHPAALDFHHISDDKEDNVSTMVINYRAKEAVLAEIAKCEVLCSNCHRIHHDQNNGPLTQW